MEPIVIKLKGFIVKNPSPLLIAILMLKKLREEKARVWIKKVMRKDALKMDREIMKEA